MRLESRQIDQCIWDEEIIADKMILLSGPRQIGKTTYVKGLLASGKSGVYLNWDNREVRKKYMQDPFFFLEKKKDNTPFLILLDEIHKRRQWKNILKGIYDTVDRSCRIFVTGSARLKFFRKSGDSLVGRYVHFNMLPISLSELMSIPLTNLWLCNAEDWKNPWKTLIDRLDSISRGLEKRGTFDHLFKFGGFPDPIVRGSERFLHKWKKDYISLLLTEDLRILTNIKQIDTAEQIVELLPTRIGSPLSITGLSRDVESTYPTVKNHISQLEKLWLLFSLRPWSNRIHRTLRKEKKTYFINWIYAGDEAKVFENMMASALSRACTIWSDLAYGDANLWYVRNFDGSEIDFLITLNNLPVLFIEAKLSDTIVSKTCRNLKEQLQIPLIQVVKKPGIWKREGRDMLILSVEKFLAVLP